MNKILKQTLILVSLVIILILPYFVFAADSETLNKLKNLGGNAGYNGATNEYTFSSILGVVVSVFLSLLGVIFVILMIYAGYNWMTASGDEQKIEKAKETITRAIIGLVITIGAYALWSFVSSII